MNPDFCVACSGCSCGAEGCTNPCGCDEPKRLAAVWTPVKPGTLPPIGKPLLVWALYGPEVAEFNGVGFMNGRNDVIGATHWSEVVAP